MGRLKRIGTVSLNFALSAGAIYAIDRILAAYEALKDLKAAEREAAAASKQANESDTKMRESLISAGKLLPKDWASKQAANVWADLNRQNQLLNSITGNFGGRWYDIPGNIAGNVDKAINPYQRDVLGLGFGHDASKAARVIRERGSDLEKYDVMRGLLDKIESMNLAPQVSETIRQSLQQAFPDSFEVAMGGSIQQLTEFANKGLTTNQALEALRVAANNAAGALDMFHPEYRFPKSTEGGPPIMRPGVPHILPSRAIGGDVKSEGAAWLHPGERILPASITRGLDARYAPAGEMHGEECVIPFDQFFGGN